MATQNDLEFVEICIGYQFRQKHLLLTALTSAGAVDELYDGNRKLANLGMSLIEFLMTYLSFEAATSRSYADDFRTRITNKEHWAAVAERIGIDRCVRYNQRQKGRKVASVTSKAMNAVMGAVFKDSGDEILRVLEVMLHIGAFIMEDTGIDPTALSLDNMPSLTSIGAMATALLGIHPQDGQESVMQAMENPSSSAPSFPGPFPQRATSVDDQAFSSGSHMERATNECEGVINLQASVEVARHEIVRKRTRDETAIHHETSDREMQNISIQQVSSRPEWNNVAAPSEASDDSSLDRTLLAPTFQIQLHATGRKGREALQQIMKCIASPEAVVTFQEILRDWRGQIDNESLLLAANPSMATKFKSLCSLDQKIAYFQLLRRYHILEMYKQAGGPATRSCISQFMTTSNDIPAAKRMVGNPIHAAEAEVTTNMMREIHPTVVAGTSEYEKKFTAMSRYRRIGLRLHMLETTFGKGIIALLPDHCGNGQLSKGVSDNVLLQPTEVSFKQMVRAVDESHGEVLRRFSDALIGMLDNLVFGTEREAQTYGFEQIEVSRIMRCHAGSDELLQLISN